MAKQCSRPIYEFSKTRNVFRAERKILKRCGNYLNKIYLETIVYMIIIIYGVRSQSYCQKYQMLFEIEKILSQSKSYLITNIKSKHGKNFGIIF